MEKHTCSGNGIFNLVRMAIVPPNTYKFNIILIKIPASVFVVFFCRHRHKIHIEMQKMENISNKLEKNKVGRHTSQFPNLPQSYTYQDSRELTSI